MKKIALLLSALLLFAAPANATFGDAAPQPGGPVAIGQVAAQVDPATNKVAIIQAPAVEQKGGGVIQLSAFGWLQPYVDTIVQALIVAGFGILGKSKYSQWLDQSSRDALETFVKNRASSLLADGAVSIRGKAIHVDNDMLYRAATQAGTAIPDALKRFGLSPDVVAAKIVDAIPQTQAGAAIVATAHKDDPAEPDVVTDRPSAPAQFTPIASISPVKLPPVAAA